MKKIVGGFLKNNDITIMMWLSILFIGNKTVIYDNKFNKKGYKEN